VELQPVFYEYAYDFHAIFRFFVFFKKRFIPAGCPVRQCCAEGHTPGDAVLEINMESRYSGMPPGFLLDIGDCRLFAGALILQRLKSCK